MSFGHGASVPATYSRQQTYSTSRRTEPRDRDVREASFDTQDIHSPTAYLSISVHHGAMNREEWTYAIVPISSE